MSRTAAVLALTVPALTVAVAPQAHATQDWALNGRYSAVSNGDWATTNDVYRDEGTVRSIWTIDMTCTNAGNCTGRVVSDAGWTADIVMTNWEYDVKRELPNWEPCGDGRTVTGHQRYRFFPVDEGGFVKAGSDVFAGFDLTSGETGACSLNEKLEIQLPFRLEKKT
jgi:hypothetical protein